MRKLLAFTAFLLTIIAQAEVLDSTKFVALYHYTVQTQDDEGNDVAFRVSDANAPEFSDPEGNATITFNVQSIEDVPSSSAKISVTGSTNQTRRFNGEDIIYIKVPVTVPMESEKTFSFTVTIKEDGCPSYTRTISRTIKH